MRRRSGKPTTVSPRSQRKTAPIPALTVARKKKTAPWPDVRGRTSMRRGWGGRGGRFSAHYSDVFFPPANNRWVADKRGSETDGDPGGILARQQASEAALNADDEFTRLRVPDRAHRSKSDAGPRGGAALWTPMGIGGAMRATLAQPPAETGSAEREGLPNDAAREGTWAPVAAPRMRRNPGDKLLFLTSCARNSLGRHERRRSSPKPSAPPCPWSSIAFCRYTSGAV